MTLIMRDSVSPLAIPLSGTQIAAGYDDGTFDDVHALHNRFPHIPNVLIDVNGGLPRAHVRDWETGDKAGSLESWVMQHNQAAGVKDAVVYCNRSTIPEVRDLTGSQVLGRDYYLWIATLDGSVFSPADLAGVLACQDKGSQQVHANYDESLVWMTAPVWWTGWTPAPPHPTAWSYPAPAAMTAMGGHTSVRLSWAKNFGGHGQPNHYVVWVYEGTSASVATQVATYPRANIPGSAVTWEGGSLTAGKTYTAHLSASGPGSENLGKGVYASATFTTG